jgi:putative ATPase
MDLFEHNEVGKGKIPLAARMRPRTLAEVIGQDHILGEGRLMRRAIEADRLNSLILFGPPGCGKTSLAEVIAVATRRRFERASGVVANVAVVRSLLQTARQYHRRDGVETILFIDEIHRFNKSQQDVLLPYVEDGSIILVGATTHNPMVFINSPLTSRSMVFELKPLAEADILLLLRRAMADAERGLGALRIDADDDALAHLACLCEGDARRALNALEVAALTTPAGPGGTIHITRTVAEDSIQKRAVVYDHDEDGHYDTISAFIKSIRGSDPHAAMYWLGKMLYAGEDPRFVARRLVILASEDVGNADPRGLMIAAAALQAVEFVGMPEARINLAQATAYLATAPKSNASYLAIDKAMGDVQSGRVLAVPRRLKNVKPKLADQPETEADRYVYPHDFDGHFVAQEYIPTSSRYYLPTHEGYEDVIAKRMEQWEARSRGRGAGKPKAEAGEDPS